MKRPVHQLGSAAVTLVGLQLCVGLAFALGCTVCPRAKEEEGIHSLGLESLLRLQPKASLLT